MPVFILWTRRGWRSERAREVALFSRSGATMAVRPSVLSRRKRTWISSRKNPSSFDRRMRG